MENIKIENQRLKVTINLKGAELSSIFDKEKNREVLWQADPSFWGRHAPILFPNVGKQFENKYKLADNVYTTKQHGFARDSIFECVSHNESEAIFELNSSMETKKIYPFDFTLRITYKLNNNDLKVSWNVENKGTNKMFFTIGGHPAFNVPILDSGDSRSDYSVMFEGKSELKYILLDPNLGTAMADNIHTLKLENSSVRITDDLFDNDALVFDDTQIESAIIVDKNGNKYVGIECKDFPNFGLWSAGKTPFVCLEPWVGRCDDNGFNLDLSQKPGINALYANEIFNKEYMINIY